MSSISLDSSVVARCGSSPLRLSNIQVPLSIREHNACSPNTPGQKRRRYDCDPPLSARRPKGPHYSQSAARRDSLPSIHVCVSPPNVASIHNPSIRTPREVRIPQHELPRKGSSTSDTKVVVPQHHDQSRSVEAMILNVPYLARIKLLGHICSPFKEPSPTIPAVQTRGAIIAVEGDDLEAIKELTEWLNNFLAKDEEFSPCIGEPPKAPSDIKKGVTLDDYLDLIKDWHCKSREMTRYITMPITHSPTFSAKDPEINTSNRKDSVMTLDSPPGFSFLGLISPAFQSSRPKMSIIILPTFQLHASVAYASRIPITDSYSPTDHWQWMATLWRGIVGPDLTLYIKSYDVKEGIGQGKMVELDDQVRCLTVLKTQGKKFTDASLRRVGFEVSEWIRGTGARKGA